MKQQKDREFKVTLICSIVLIFILLLSCASTNKTSQLQIDELFVRAGFQLRKADTPKKLTFIKSLPQRKLINKKHDGKLFYFYVDGSSCQCAYIGDDQAYHRFRELVKALQMEDKVLTTSNQEQQALDNIDIDPDDFFADPLSF